MDGEKVFDYVDESHSEKLQRKTKESPLMVIGLIGFTLIAGIGIYKFKTRPKNVSASVYLTQLRVVSQGAVVGALTGGMIYQLTCELLGKNDDKSS